MTDYIDWVLEAAEEQEEEDWQWARMPMLRAPAGAISEKEKEQAHEGSAPRQAWPDAVGGVDGPAPGAVETYRSMAEDVSGEVKFHAMAGVAPDEMKFHSGTESALPWNEERRLPGEEPLTRAASGGMGALATARWARPGAREGYVHALNARIRRTAVAAAYRATGPADLRESELPLMREAVLPSAPGVAYVRRETLPELDAAVRRDARRYDGGFELY